MQPRSTEQNTMKTVAILLLVCVIGALGVVVPTSRDLDEDWKLWKSVHGKNYGSYSAELERRLIWEDNLKFILKHNLEESLGKTSFLLKMNEFGDLTNAEFVATRTGLKQGQPPVALKPSSFTRSPRGIPDKVDWRDQGYVTPIKDQGQCGSCWAFSAVASLEGQLFAKSGKLVSLSEQNLVDCSTAEGDAGCGGGWPVWAYTYIEKNNGIDTEAGYPYRGVEGNCEFNPSYVGTSITGFTPLPPSEEALEQSLATIGPISVCIDAAHQSFQFYSTGVYYEPDCSSEELDHCVTAVGYDYTENNAKYYIVKNSWGTSWGQEGYIWMARDYNNQCGIATNASYPLL